MPSLPRASALPRVDEHLESLGHCAFEWHAGRGWWTSPAGRTLLGLAPGDDFVDDRRWWSCLHADDRAGARAQGARLERGAEVVRGELRLAACGGGRLLFHARAGMRDAAGALQRISGTLTALDDRVPGSRATLRDELRVVETVDQAHIAWYERDGSLIRGSSIIAELFDLDDKTGPWSQAAIFARLSPLELERHSHDLRRARSAPDALFATHVTNYRITRRDGSVRDIEIRYRIVDAGEPLRSYGLIFDVTATKVLEAKFQDAMEHAGVAWFERDIATDVLVGSRSLWRLYGLDPEQQPLHFADLAHRVQPDDWRDHPAHGEVLRAASRARGDDDGAGPAGSVRYRVRRDDGGWRWIEVRYVSRLDGLGGGAVSGLVVDVTAAQQAADALRTGRARLLLALETVRMATWQWDLAAGRFDSNDVLADLFGLPRPGPWPIEQFFDRVHPDDRAPLMQATHDMLARSPSDVLSAEFRLDCADGYRWFEVRARNDGAQVLGVSIDITARRQAETEQEQLRQQLQQAQKMEAIGQLTGGIAHDFNNILASVLGYADLALRHHGEHMPARLVDYVREMQHGGRRARDLVRQLLTFSRDEGGVTAPVAVGLVVEQALRMLRPTLPASIVIATRVAPALPAVLADAVQLQQVVMNLCINARDAMAGAGHIDITVTRRNVADAVCASCQQRFASDSVVIAVSDTGPGIAPARQARIFEPFYTSKSPGQGTGMGLSMVHGIVHRLGGHIRLDEAPGHGALFEILLPATTAAPRAEIAPPSRRAARPGGAHVLVVDDEPGVARFVGELLELEGYQVDIENDARRALARLLAAGDAFDVVVSDQTMPGLSGAELVTRLRECAAGPPVILMSGYSATLDAARAARLGAHAYLAKPLDATTLLDAVASALAD